ncbi:TetR/AcrR family transcriptional regulator [Mycobacterium crocinum]|nr:TetR/AcrR family transcriptional regulator [Mycolicibacterium crocinum]
MPGRATDRTGAKILDAALRVLVDFGVKRATVDLVANYAGVSHMTVYRRWSTRNEVLRVAVLNELAVVVQHAVTRVEGAGSFPDQVVSAFTELVDSLRRHPLLVRVLSTEPEVLMSLLSDRSIAVLDWTVPIIGEALERLSGQPLHDPDTLADVFVRLAQSVLLLERSDRPLSTRHDVALYARQALASLARDAAPDAAVVAAPRAGRRAVMPLMAASAAAVLFGGGLLLNPVVHDVMHTDVVGTVSSAPSPPATKTRPPSPPSELSPAPADPPAPHVSTTASWPLPSSSPTTDVSTTSTSRTPRPSPAPPATQGNGSGSINSPSFRPQPPHSGGPGGPQIGPRTPGAAGEPRPGAPGPGADGPRAGRGPA